jgi:hypothetical protein
MRTLTTSLSPQTLILAALGMINSPTHAAKLTATDGTTQDRFGWSVSQSGSIGLVGAYYDDIGAISDQGSAYVFRNLDTATGTITENVKLTASDGAASDQFGWSVSQSGSIGLVGASKDDIGVKIDQGSAYVFRSLDTATNTVTENFKLTASDGAAGDEFGYSVSQSGSVGLVGAYLDDIGANNGQGSAYLFRSLDAATGSVTESVKLTASDGAAGDVFGISVSLSGNIGLVGARGDDFGSNTFQGSAYVFRSLDTATGTITENVKLTASDGAVNDQFGYSVSQSGSIGLVGAYLDNAGPNWGNDQGSAYVFRSLDTATGTVTQNVKLTASDGAASDRFGISVSQSGSTGLVGAFSDDIGAISGQGSAYVFRNLDTATGTITENVKLIASDGAANDYFGLSVGLDGDQFTIGAYYRGKAYAGSVASVTTLDAGNASKVISGISFFSQDNWVIGDTTDANQVTLSAADKATVTTSGTSVFVGRSAGSDNNRLIVAGNLTANQVIVGNTGNTGNTLELKATGSLNVATTTINSGGTLTAAGPITGNVTNNGTVRVTGGATLQVSGTFTNNGVLDLLTGSQTLPANFVNNGVVLDSQSVKVISATKAGSDYVLTVHGYAGHGYQLQRSDTLAGQWTNLGSVQNGTGQPLTFTDTGGAVGPARFYRIAVAP